ncbi:MAG: uracil phosphoribosyltransferase [Flavobacteriales bacterium]|nr:uracil phosphoribosyltransferase [Flavobacteriales bacterium]|tara:strand:+ start:189075 stop:189725 length:651 start_codon:yes stop_codon:yes gene_type:complete
MKIINLGSENTIFNQFIAEIRDVNIQGDSMRFRRNCERLGEIFAYEISKRLTYKKQEVVTPLGVAEMSLLKEQPVLATILRAGLPLHQGLLNYFDKADNAFVSAYRKHHKDGSFVIEAEYMASPDLTDRTVILSDPMLASGASMVEIYKLLLEKGKPSNLHVVTLIASVEGVNYIKKHLPEDTTVWVGAVDDELTAQSYIVPGLGDAGDLAFGAKE